MLDKKNVKNNTSPKSQASHLKNIEISNCYNFHKIEGVTWKSIKMVEFCEPIPRVKSNSKDTIFPTNPVPSFSYQYAIYLFSNKPYFHSLLSLTFLS